MFLLNEEMVRSRSRDMRERAQAESRANRLLRARRLERRAQAADRRARAARAAISWS